MKNQLYKIFLILILISFGLIAIYTFLVLYKSHINQGFSDIWMNRFDINMEANIPTWYSTILLYSVSILSFLIYIIYTKIPSLNRFQRLFWLIFGSMFCFLSIDEAAMIHEIIDQTTSVKWVFVYAPLMGIFFLYCIYYFLAIRREELILRNWVIGGLMVYALGGIGAEYIAYSMELSYAFRMIEYVVEEGLELIGISMVLMGCLYELNNRFKELFTLKLENND